jgi:hypothetical protein
MSNYYQFTKECDAVYSANFTPNGNTDLDAFIQVNNYMYDQGDKGFDPIRLAVFLKKLLEAGRFSKVSIKEMNRSAIKNSSVERTFPRRAVIVQKLPCNDESKLVARIKKFNELFNDSATYAIFEDNLKKEMSPARPVATVAAPAKPVPQKAPVPTGVSFAAVAKAPSKPATPAAKAAPVETPLQYLERLKNEHEKLAQTIKQMEQEVNAQNSAELKALVQTAVEKGDKFLQDLLTELKAKVKLDAKVEPDAKVKPDAKPSEEKKEEKTDAPLHPDSTSSPIGKWCDSP